MEDAAAAGDEIGGAPIWSATTNWIPAAGGSISDAISYDTSDEIENEVTAKPLLLMRPEGDDPPPCEITICFRKMHEIHRVYLRSTARVYEIYYSPDEQDSSEEYLCTVRCSAAVREMIPESVDIGANNGTAARKVEVGRSDSNISDEDGWVQVKASDSSLQDDKEYPMSNKCDIGIDSPIMQIHYEATADISDYSPCVSLKLRLLSIQTKACVHIEEIYVYADPVEPSNSVPSVSMGESMGRSSLLAMLVPTLMQMSKSRGIEDKCFSKEARVSEYQHVSAEATQTVSSVMRNTAAQEACSGESPDQKTGIGQEQTAIEPEEVHSEHIHEVMVPDKMPNSLADDNNRQAYSRIEKVLDELVLKVGRVEAFCLKFEENMLKPLSCMEQRLQQLELKLDALAVKNLPSEQCLCSRVSSLESNEYDSKNNDGNTVLTETNEDTCFISAASPAEEAETFDLESQTHSGLVIKAPEFLNEDDDCSYNKDSLNTSVDDLHKQKKPLTIDGALASSLAALLTSTTVKSHNPIPSQTRVTQESVNVSNSCADSLAGVTSDGAGDLSDKSVLEDNILDAGREGTSVGNSSLTSCDAAIVNDELSSDMKNRCTYFDFGEGTTFDNSLLAADDNVSPAYPSHADSGFIVTAPEFLNSSGSFNSDDTIDSPDLDGLEHQASIPLVNQGVPQVAEFTSATILQSTEKISTLFGVPSELSSIDCNLSASTVAVPRVGADQLGGESHEENVINDDVWSEPIWSRSPLEVSYQPEHHDGLGLKEWLSRKKDELFAQTLHDHTLSELNAAVSQICHSGSNADDEDIEDAILHCFNQHGSCQGGSNVDDREAKDSILHGFNQHEGVDVSGRENSEENAMQECVDLILSRLPLEASSEQVHQDGLGLNEWLSCKNADGLLARNLHGHTFPELNAEVSQNCHMGKSADDDDANAALLHVFNQHHRVFEDSIGTSSGLHKNPIKQRDETEWDAAPRNYANDPTFEFEKTIGQADLTTNTSQSTAGCNQETPNKEAEDAICNVKFNPEGNWVSGMPLELLLGEMQDAELPELSTGGLDGECGAAGQNSSSGSLLAEVPLFTPYEDAGS